MCFVLAFEPKTGSKRSKVLRIKLRTLAQIYILYVYTHDG